MLSIEDSIKKQFAKIFRQSDWPLFKRIAEVNIQDAVHLRKADMRVQEPWRLLARNARKRLLIGVGMELILKAVYLKKGYCINTPHRKGKQLAFPFTHAQAEGEGIALVPGNTFSFDRLIGPLTDILDFESNEDSLRGLRIAKVFRNKEGHSVSMTHTYDSSNYRNIERSLMDIYQSAFGEELKVQISFGDETPIWKASKLDSDK